VAIYALSLHDALPIYRGRGRRPLRGRERHLRPVRHRLRLDERRHRHPARRHPAHIRIGGPPMSDVNVPLLRKTLEWAYGEWQKRSEEHTSELQSRENL